MEDKEVRRVEVRGPSVKAECVKRTLRKLGGRGVSLSPLTPDTQAPTLAVQ